MKGGTSNKKYNLNNWESEFRRYRILVKVFRQNRVEQQNLEIFTTGLQQLLELRRIHTIAFSTPPSDQVLEFAKSN